MSKAAELANLIGNINAGGGGANKNAIINGAMNVAQRSVSATGLGASSGYFTCDRWLLAQSSAGRLTMSQDSSVPTGKGFANSLKLDCTTADTSIASSEFLQIVQKIEGQNLQAFAKGTSDAKPFALSFYVKANATFNFVCELNDLDNSRHISKLFSTTTDWVKHEITFPADTTGAFDNDNSASLNLTFWLHAGSTYSSGTLNTASFGSRTDANRAAGVSSFYSSTDNNFFITGVQLEVGQNPTSFEHEPFERTLLKCQRYYYKFGGQNSFEHIPGIGQGNGSTFSTHYQHPVPMRAGPTLNLGGDWRINDTYLGSYYTFSGVGIDNATILTCRVYGNTSSAIGSDLGRILAYGDINAKWEHSAEL